jgi:ribosome-binding factor A
MHPHPQKSLRRPLGAFVRSCYRVSTQQPVIARIPRPTTTVIGKPPHYNCRSFSTEPFHPEEANPGLASVISQGLSSLESTASQIESKTRRVSLDQTPIARGTPSHRQLSEGHRILQVATECLEALCEAASDSSSSSSSEARYLMLLDEPISILEVQVNRDLKQAKVFWTLPYGVLLDDRVLNSGNETYQRLMTQMEAGVSTHGQKILSKHVHNQLRSYYPPRLRLVPATKAMVNQAVEEMVLL